jgi:hypothetical protein
VTGRFVVVRDGDDGYRFRIEAEDGHFRLDPSPASVGPSGLPGDESSPMRAGVTNSFPSEMACIAVAAVVLAGLLRLRAVGLPARPVASRQDPSHEVGERHG